MTAFAALHPIQAVSLGVMVLAALELLFELLEYYGGLQRNG